MSAAPIPARRLGSTGDDHLIEADPVRLGFGAMRRRPPVYAAGAAVMAGTAWATGQPEALLIAVGLAVVAAIAVMRAPGPETIGTFTADVVVLTGAVVFIGLEPLAAIALFSAIVVVAYFGLSPRHGRLIVLLVAGAIALTLGVGYDWAIVDLSERARMWVSIALTAIGFSYLVTVIPALAGVTRHVLREADATAEAQRREADFRAGLASMVAHELRNPLAGIRGFVDVLRQSGDGLPREERSEYLEIIGSQVASLEGIVEDLLVAVQSDRGTLTVGETEFDVAALTRRLVSELEPDFRESVLVEADGAVVAVGDPARVGQIVRNLLSNARKYGGDRVTVGVSRHDGQAQVVVHDDGSGVSPDDEERIFERFEGTAKGSGGYGLGLPIARDLAQAMGGDLRYRRGPGATFVLTLPAA
ncbi:MAG: HAMP domain-containing sensor histidine kinase [Acidimicrobiia bacterium]|nr:HAMP domain-containing sensor histidine kinase [Acidimicrobiia bacterium]